MLSLANLGSKCNWEFFTTQFAYFVIINNLAQTSLVDTD
jgi:hypothetical protein